MRVAALLLVLSSAVALAGAHTRSLSQNPSGTVVFPYHQCTIRTGSPCFFTGPTVTPITGGKEFCFTAVCPGCEGQPNQKCCTALEEGIFKIVWDIQYGCRPHVKDAFFRWMTVDGVPLTANAYIDDLIDTSKTPPRGFTFARWTKINEPSADLDGTEICIRAEAPCDTPEALFVYARAGFPRIAMMDLTDAGNGCCPERYPTFPPPPSPSVPGRPLSPLFDPPSPPPPGSPRTPGTPANPPPPRSPRTPGTPPPPRSPGTPGTPPPPRSPGTPGTPPPPRSPRTPGTPGTPPPPRSPRAPLRPVLSPPPPPPPGNNFPYCKCSRGAENVVPYSVAYSNSYALLGSVVYCFKVSVDTADCTGGCCDMALDKIEFLSSPTCSSGSVTDYWTSLDETRKAPAWSRQYDSKLGQDTASLKLNRLGLTTSNADGVLVCFALKAGSKCSDLESLCIGGPADTCKYAVFDKPDGCCSADYAPFP